MGAKLLEPEAAFRHASGFRMHDGQLLGNLAEITQQRYWKRFSEEAIRDHRPMDPHRIRLKAVDTGGGSDRIENTPKHDRRFGNLPPVGRQVVAEHLDDAIEHVSGECFVVGGVFQVDEELPPDVGKFRDANDGLRRIQLSTGCHEGVGVEVIASEDRLQSPRLHEEMWTSGSERVELRACQHIRLVGVGERYQESTEKIEIDQHVVPDPLRLRTRFDHDQEVDVTDPVSKRPPSGASREDDSADVTPASQKEDQKPEARPVVPTDDPAQRRTGQRETETSTADVR